ncbi:MAG: 5-formyltetrahydrofolate cyclo-ligase [Lachnospiraceae bacterium]|nr:5-formyltetrahydrofolate cyclo-ligase [Lachnospiraceae bacterium]
MDDSVRERKRTLRRKVLSLRDAMSDELRKSDSALLCSKIQLLTAYGEADKVLLYASYGSETDTTSLILDALKSGKEVYLPRVEGEKMQFYRIEDPADLMEGYKGIREPAPREESKLMLTNCKSFLLVPGVAFDEEGARIGYGKGFYDRFLKSIEGIEMPMAAMLFSCQLVDTGLIPMEETDRKIECLITPDRLIRPLDERK